MTDKRSKILVIEDNKEVLEGILKILDLCGYAYEGVTHFSENVFDKLKTDHFDLVILDVMLSGNDGRELVRRFKDTEEIRKLPVLMISAYTNIENSVRKSRADDFLQKPFGVTELSEKIKQCLGRTGDR